MSVNFKNKLNKLNEFGFCKIKIGYKPFLSKLRKKWLKMFNNISHEIYGKKITNDKDLIALEKSKFRKAFVAVFDLIHLDPEIYNLASQKKLIQIYKNLGIKHLSLIQSKDNYL